jgi:hypothetical protein
MVLEEGKDWNDAGGRDEDGQLVFPDGKPATSSATSSPQSQCNVLLNVLGQTRHEILTISMQRLGFLSVLVRRVHDWHVSLRLGVSVFTLGKG